jgi:hypothetical protein
MSGVARRLIVDQRLPLALADAVTATDTVLHLTPTPGVPVAQLFHGGQRPAVLHELRGLHYAIGVEIVRFVDYVDPADRSRIRVRRGAEGTKPAAHDAGAQLTPVVPAIGSIDTATALGLQLTQIVSA